MSGIDDLLDGVGDKANVVERARRSKKALIVHLPDDEEDRWYINFHGLTFGDMAYVAMLVTAHFVERYNSPKEPE